MKRLRTRHPEGEAIDLYDALGRRSGYSIGDSTSADRFTHDVAEALKRATTNPLMLHGRRAEAMFAFVAGALGKAALVRQEDAGEVYAADSSLQIPDYRLVLLDGQEFFV